MRSEEMRALVLRALTEVAPEADPATVELDTPLQEQLDLDSMDFLQFLENLAAESGVEIPERDAGSLATVQACVDYLERKQLV